MNKDMNAAEDEAKQREALPKSNYDIHTATFKVRPLLWHEGTTSAGKHFLYAYSLGQQLTIMESQFEAGVYDVDIVLVSRSWNIALSLHSLAEAKAYAERQHVNNIARNLMYVGEANSGVET